MSIDTMAGGTEKVKGIEAEVRKAIGGLNVDFRQLKVRREDVVHSASDMIYGYQDAAEDDLTEDFGAHLGDNTRGNPEQDVLGYMKTISEDEQRAFVDCARLHAAAGKITSVLDRLYGELETLEETEDRNDGDVKAEIDQCSSALTIIAKGFEERMGTVQDDFFRHVLSDALEYLNDYASSAKESYDERMREAVIDEEDEGGEKGSANDN